MNLVESQYSYDGIYDRIETAWRHAGFESAAKLSAVSSIKEGTISKWKNGSVPSTYQLLTVCNYCDCDIDYLLGRIETFKRKNAPIHEETGLAEAAIDVLRDYQQANKPVQMFDGTIAVDPGLPLPSAVADFVSFLIVHPAFKDLAERILQAAEQQSDLEAAAAFRNQFSVSAEMQPFYTPENYQETVSYMLTRDLNQIVTDFIKTKGSNHGKSNE